MLNNYKTKILIKMARMLEYLAETILLRVNSNKQFDSFDPNSESFMQMDIDSVDEKSGTIKFNNLTEHELHQHPDRSETLPASHDDNKLKIDTSLNDYQDHDVTNTKSSCFSHDAMSEPVTPSEPDQYLNRQFQSAIQPSEFFVEKLNSETTGKDVYDKTIKEYKNRIFDLSLAIKNSKRDNSEITTTQKKNQIASETTTNNQETILNTETGLIKPVQVTANEIRNVADKEVLLAESNPADRITEERVSNDPVSDLNSNEIYISDSTLTAPEHFPDEWLSEFTKNAIQSGEKTTVKAYSENPDSGEAENRINSESYWPELPGEGEQKHTSQTGLTEQFWPELPADTSSTEFRMLHAEFIQLSIETVREREHIQNLEFEQNGLLWNA